MKTAAQIRAEIRKADKRTDDSIYFFLSRVSHIFHKSLDRITERLSTDPHRAIEAAAMINNLEAAMQDLGLGNQYEILVTEFREQLNDMRAVFRDVDPTLKGRILSDVDTDLAASLIRMSVENVAATVAEYQIDAKQALISRIITGEMPSASEIMQQIEPRLASKMKTELDTMYRGFNQEMTTRKALELRGKNPMFLYIGPMDGITRPFCRKTLSSHGEKHAGGPIYSLSEIKKMDNGQGLDVMTFRGGWNCRHRWRPVSEALIAEMTEGIAATGKEDSYHPYIESKDKWQ